ncbi:hypothetical protein [Paenibacillus azoreducens]|uniref:DUF4879 domain-containing protein n=1 Tax=Paenibacillus azoreducens TaxID=116718 RepID=A0A919YIZ8_9BACL|nr:hypothetical protein [Paenibacillus azoreducens]GIO51649.1 hypothetical protein J34TS1_64140 [Paenibacillus azoreducens]
MKRLRRIFATVALAACLMVFGASNSAFALTGFADTMDTAAVMYRAGGGPSYDITIPLDSPTDHDWYVVDNSGGSDTFWYYVILTPPPGINLQFQWVRTDAYNNIIETGFNNFNGPGQEEGRGASAFAGEKTYFRVMPVGYNDYDPSVPYRFQFVRTD